MGFSRLKNHAFKLNKDCEQSKNLFPEKGSEVSRPKNDGKPCAVKVARTV